MIQTAGGITTNHIKRSGYGDFPDNTGDWTIFVRFKYPSTPSGLSAIVLSLFDGVTDFTDPYLFIGSQNNTGDVYFEIYDGTNFNTSAFTAIVNNDQNWCAMVKSGNSVLCYLNGTLISTLTVAISAIVWDSLYLLGDGSAGLAEPLSVAYCRCWSNALIISELTTEATSILATKQTGLIWDCPLQTSIDLTSHNNTLNQLIGVGTVTTDTDDPLLSVVAGPPTNIDPATAMTVNLDSAFFIDTLSGGSAAAETWYKYTAQASDRWLGSIGFGDLTTFQPTLRIYEGLANANSLTAYKNISPASNGAAQFTVTAGNDYYFGCFRNGAVTPAIAIISIIRGPNIQVPVGAVAINDDVSSDYPAVFVSTVNDGVVYNFADIVAGEQADVLPTGGYSLVADQIVGPDNNIYNSLFQLITNITSIASLTARIRTCNTPNRWYLSLNINPPTVRTIDQDGTIGSTITLTGSTSIAAHAASNDETILYFAETGTNKPIKTWDLVSNVAGANLAVGIANYTVTDILYLSDDTIAVMYYKSSVARDGKLVIYSAAGATLVNVSLGTPNGQTGPRICYAINDPTSIWCYIRDGGSSAINSSLLNVTAATGAIASTRIVPTFESGANVISTTNTPYRFGASFSCPIWVVRVASLAPPATASGLYKLTGTNINNPVVRHDTIWLNAQIGTTESRAIPDPYFESYLAGDE